MIEDKILCKTPTPNKKPVKIDKWKYDTIKSTILKVVPKVGTGQGVLFKELTRRVEVLLTPEQIEQLGSINWHTTCVRLDMEIKGELTRVKDDYGQRLYQT